MRILVTGASGMLGATLCKSLSKAHKVYATGGSAFYDASVDYKVFDFLNGDYTELIEWSRPEVIILSGALTNGSICQKNPRQAYEANGFSIKSFLNNTTEDVKIIYISTDAVFPSRLSMATEEDVVSPESIYGRSKELGEYFVSNSGRSFCTIRTTIVGLNDNVSKKGFLEWIIESSKAEIEIGLFDDVYFTPITIWQLANEIEYLVGLNRLPNEILHIVGTDRITKYNFGIQLLDTLGLGKNCVNRSFIVDMKDRAKRSTDQTLDSSYYQTKFCRKLPNMQDIMISIKQNYEEHQTRT
ncbi:sugar nucleotide-binding protein [Winogradskyella maritima]|uniref:SDR family oxidoreductase n=1 Tax=Winogradskyella maritima TaxID=1517766 RepID=A0ABV8ADL4_9FLAO|nr:sugar nucleotide-binding protein [Winogradskyella maritima]